MICPEQARSPIPKWGKWTVCYRTCYGGGLGAVWCWSGGGLTWVAQSTDIQPLTRLVYWLWVRLSGACIDGVGTANARRVPDVDCVRYWNQVIYAINTRGG